jgi:hypothetical protein
MKVFIKYIAVVALMVFLQTPLSGAVLAPRDAPYTMGVTAGYLGELVTRPGFITGVEYIPLQSKKYHKLVVTGNLGFYYHFRNTINLFVNSEIGYRFTAPPGFMFDLLLGVGYLHSWLDSGSINAIYEVNDAGELQKAGYTGSSYFWPTFQLGIGWDLSRKTGVNLLFFSRIGVGGRYPHVGYMLPHLFLTTGATWYFNIYSKK